MSSQTNMPSDSPSTHKSWWRRLYWIFVLAVMLFFVPILYQTFRLIHDPRVRLVATAEYASTAGPLILAVDYPKEVYVDASDPAGPPVSIWLAWATSTPSPAATFILTEKSGPVMAPTLASTGSPAPTSTPTATPTPTPTLLPYVIALRPSSNDLVFTDKYGVPVLAQVALTPASYPITPAALFVRRASGNTPGTVPLIIELYGPDDSQLIPSQPVKADIETENIFLAWFLQFGDLLLGPTTVIAGVAVAIFGFAKNEYQRRLEQQQRQEQERIKWTITAQIEELKSLAGQNSTEAVRQYYDCRTRVLGPQGDIDAQNQWHQLDVITQLNEAWKVIDQQPWRQRFLEEIIEHLCEPNELLQAHDAIQMACELDPDCIPFQTVRRVADFALNIDLDPSYVERANDKNKIIDSLLHLDRDFGGGDATSKIRRRTVSSLSVLINSSDIDLISPLAETDQGRELLRDPECRNRLVMLGNDSNTPLNDRQKIREVLDRCGKVHYWSLPLWPAERPGCDQNQKDWLRAAELAFDPFGPDVAEFDPLLPDFNVVLLGGKDRAHLYGNCPTLIIGDPGSGKTATALLLSNKCHGPSDTDGILNDVLPVYYPVWANMDIRRNRLMPLKLLAYSIAKTIIRYVVWDPLSFLQLSSSRQNKLSQLFSTCAGSSSQVTNWLNEASEGAVSPRLVRAIAQIQPDVRGADDLNQQDWIDLLDGALPHGFTRLYAIIDIPPTQNAKEPKTANQIRPLLDLGILLATKQIYIKMFVPTTLCPELSNLDGFETIQLAWSKDQLRAMLEQRIHQASGEGDAAGRKRLEDLCELRARGIGVDDRLIKQARTPREIIHWGRRLLELHVELHPSAPQLSEEDIMAWQAEMDK